MKHLLNNLSSEEKNRILEQYKNSLLIETKNFKKLINVKSGSVNPLLLEGDPTSYQHPIRRPTAALPVTPTTTLSPEQIYNQQLEQASAQAREKLQKIVVVGSTFTLYDDPNNSKELGVYKILGQKNLRDLNQPPTQIDLSTLKNTAQITFAVEALEGSDTKEKNFELILTFKCNTKRGNKQDAHALTMGKKPIGFLGKVAYAMKDKTAYAKGLTSLLISGYCDSSGNNLTLKTDIPSR